jgi:hypothetical protein
MRSRSLVRAATVAPLALVALLALASAASADTETQRRSLAGVGGLHVHIALAGDDLATNELTEGSLRTEIEGRIAASGLRVLSADESAREPGVPWLFVTLAIQKATDARFYAWSLRCELEQRVCLERDRETCVSAATWSAHRFGSVGTRRVKTLRTDVQEATNAFVAAYLAANAKN